MKDLDLMLLNDKSSSTLGPVLPTAFVPLWGEPSKERLMEALEKDARFLSGEGVIDYSLLVGIETGVVSTNKVERGRRKFVT